MNIFSPFKANKILIQKQTEKLEDVKSHPLSPSIQSGSSSPLFSLFKFLYYYYYYYYYLIKIMK